MDKLYLCKKIVKKEGKEPFAYVQLLADLGYNKLVLSMDKNVIAELLGVAVKDLFNINENEFVECGQFKVDYKVGA